MIELTIPEQVGLSSARLERLAAHFNRYVDAGKIPGYLVLVARRGKAAYLHRYGMRDVEAGRPVEADTIFRIYSMSKPITSVGVMMLYERGLLQLDDPASEFISGFDRLEVFESGDATSYQTVPAEREMTIRDLLTHTSGLTYGHLPAHPLDEIYRQRRFFEDPDMTLADLVGQLSDLPLLFSPGSRWNYSVATRCPGPYHRGRQRGCARSVFRGRDLRTAGHGRYRLFRCGPSRSSASPPTTSGMKTASVSSTNPGESSYLQQPKLPSGGGGLVSTASDYLRFCRMLLNKGGLDGARILGAQDRRTHDPESSSQSS